jgi:hypothetical protein
MMAYASPNDMRVILVGVETVQLHCRICQGCGRPIPRAAASRRAPRQALAPGAALQERYDAWVFDLDGTLWRGQQLIEGAAEALQLLRNQVWPHPRTSALGHALLAAALP